MPDWKHILRERLAGLKLDPRREAEIVEELAQHLEQLYSEARSASGDEEQARSAAMAHLERSEVLVREIRRAERPRPLPESNAGITPGAGPRTHWIVDFGHDLRYALRALRRNPVFALVTILALALGIGANTAIFSVVDAVLLRPLPYHEPERLFLLNETKPGEDSGFGLREASWGDFEDWAAQDSVFDGVAGFDGGSLTLTGEGLPQRIPIFQVTDNFFDVLGVQAARGRTLLPGESGREIAYVVVLTHAAWQSRFGGDPGIVGRKLTLNNYPFTVVGVLPATFHFPFRGTAEFCIPLGVSARQVELRYWHWLDVVARLKPGVTPEQAESQLRTASTRAAEVDPKFHSGTAVVTTAMREDIVGRVRPALLVLLAGVGLVLLIACANVANLLLARATARRKETGIRAALGASRSRLVRQLLAESLLLALLGGATGLLAAQWGTSLLLSGIPQRQLLSLPHLVGLRLDAPLFLFALGLSLLTSLLFGLAPALRSAATGLVESLKASRGCGGPDRSRLRDVLVVTEIALALTLVVAAGLLAKSLVSLLAVSPGFETVNLFTGRISLPGAYQDFAKRVAFHDRLLERVAALPGVRTAAVINQLPLTGRGNSGSFTIERQPGRAPVEVNIRNVSPAYFSVMGLALDSGRLFDDRDRTQAPRVVLINRTLARQVFPGENPLGHRVMFSFFQGQPWWEIVGVVGDEKMAGLDGEITPVLYFPYAQDPYSSFSLVVRSALPPESLARAIQQEVAALDPTLPLYDSLSMTQIIDDSQPVFLRRYVMFLTSGFSTLAALLAAVGIYGLMAFLVGQRTHEIGLRFALGAQRRDVLSLVVGHGLRLAAIGIGAGLVVSAFAVRLLASLLYGVSPFDPAVLGGASALLLAITLLACLVPARRAMRVDPMVALRYE